MKFDVNDIVYLLPILVSLGGYFYVLWLERHPD